LLSESEQVSLDLRVFYLFFFANFDYIRIANLVSNFTCFIIFWMGMDLRGSTLLSCGSFAPKF